MRSFESAPNRNAAATAPVVIEVRPRPPYAAIAALLRSDRQSGGERANRRGASIAGKVVAIGVDLGSFVRRGQMLVRLDERFASAGGTGAGATRSGESRGAADRREDWFAAGTEFRSLRMFRKSRSARRRLNLAEKNLRRAEKLIESGDVSRSFYDQQRAQRDQLKEQYEVALAQARQNYARSVAHATSRG